MLVAASTECFPHLALRDAVDRIVDLEYTNLEIDIHETGQHLKPSAVAADLEAAPSPWGGTAALVISPPLVRGADHLRRTILPSLLEARGTNVAVGAPHGDLFEIARGYLARAGGGGPNVSRGSGSSSGDSVSARHGTSSCSFSTPWTCSAR